MYPVTTPGCHDALAHIKNYWGGTKWFIEGDISNCFDEIDHQILITLLRKKIKDERFLNLIWKSLKAGYMEFNIPFNSINGTPQGSIISPILANVYLHELDVFVEKLNIEIGGHKAKRRLNPVYRKHSSRVRYLRKKISKLEGLERDSAINEKRRIEKLVQPFVPYLIET